MAKRSWRRKGADSELCCNACGVDLQASGEQYVALMRVRKVPRGGTLTQELAKVCRNCASRPLQELSKSRYKQRFTVGVEDRQALTSFDHIYRLLAPKHCDIRHLELSWRDGHTLLAAVTLVLGDVIEYTYDTKTKLMAPLVR